MIQETGKREMGGSEQRVLEFCNKGEQRNRAEIEGNLIRETSPCLCIDENDLIEKEKKNEMK